jgi:hypothetical protein
MSTVGGDTSKGLLLPFFDGEPSKFKGWWMRFKSYATIKNFSHAIQRVAETDLPDKEATDVSSDQAKRAARNRNLMAISCLTMAFQDDALLNMIEQLETANWPSGLAYLVVDELSRKYRPVDIISRVEMRTKLSKVTMKSSDDPRVLLRHLSKAFGSCCTSFAHDDEHRKGAPSARTLVGRCYKKDCKISRMDNYNRVHDALSAVHNR